MVFQTINGPLFVTWITAVIATFKNPIPFIGKTELFTYPLSKPEKLVFHSDNIF